jgi:uncharacterized protein YuzE
VQVGKLRNEPDTDARDMDLLETPGVESQETSAGVVLDYDAAGHLVGIDIDNAGQQVTRSKLTFSKLPSILHTE